MHAHVELYRPPTWDKTVCGHCRQFTPRHIPSQAPASNVRPWHVHQPGQSSEWRRAQAHLDQLICRGSRCQHMQSTPTQPDEVRSTCHPSPHAALAPDTPHAATHCNCDDPSQRSPYGQGQHAPSETGVVLISHAARRRGCGEGLGPLPWHTEANGWLYDPPVSDFRPVGFG